METLREKIGQMIMVGCQGEYLSAEERLVFAEYAFGGFVLFRRNCAAPRQILSLCRDLRHGTAESPPLIAIDQEGGSVHRLPPPFTHFPAAAALGARADCDLAYRVGKAVATELSLVGINLNFAPVLDVDSNPQNPIIGARAFGADPRTVTEIGLAWSRGLRAGGVIPCAKHFPGHGGTDRDSHLELPVVKKSSAELEAVELPPFRAACREGFEALMTAHVKYTALDPKWPATLSEAIVTGILRHQLGYDGVVFSDDMEMKAIGGQCEAGEAALLSVRAGVDVLLFCHDLAKAVDAAETLHAAAGSDPGLRARVEASNRRIAALKQRSVQEFTGVPEEEAEERFGRLAHRKLAAEIHGSL